jgi:hypothetical protein
MSDTRYRPHRDPIVPDRIRRIDGGFAFIPNRFLRDGFFSALTDAERSLYLFLVLAGDRNGVSYYSYDKICSTLEVSVDDYLEVRNNLIAKDLLAFDGTRFQVLSLPARPVVKQRASLSTQGDFENDDPATIRQLIRSSLGKP